MVPTSVTIRQRVNAYFDDVDNYYGEVDDGDRRDGES